MHFVSLLLMAPIYYVASQCEMVSIRSNDDVNIVKSCYKIGSLKISGEVKQVIMDNLQEVESGISITGTSGLNSVSFASLQYAEEIEITNNSGLASANFASLSKVNGKLFISGNSPKLEVEVNKLTSVGDSLTFSNCSGVEISSLSSVGKSASFTGSSFQNLNLTNFKSVDKDFSFTGNDHISVLTLPSLDTVGGTVLIANNTVLESVAFPTLSAISGSLEVSGSLNKLVFDALNEIHGSANVTSSSNRFKCKDMEAINSVTQGKYACDNGQPSSSSSSSKTSKSTAPSSDARSPLSFTPIQCIISIVFGMMFI